MSPSRFKRVHGEEPRREALTNATKAAYRVFYRRCFKPEQTDQKNASVVRPWEVAICASVRKHKKGWVGVRGNFRAGDPLDA